MDTTKSVLIVDDDLAIVEALSLMIEDAGYDVRTLREGETLETMHEDLPGVLLLDIWLSGQDGREICTYLKSQKVTQSLPIILVSANSDIKRLAQESGAEDYLAKPFSMKEVIAKVEKYLAP